MTAIQDPEPITIKLMLVGDASVGKTSLLLRFTDEGRYEQNKLTAATIGVDFRVCAHDNSPECEGIVSYFTLI
jgi:hypothetical protein